MKGLGLGFILLLPGMALAAQHNNTVKMVYVGGAYGETTLDVSSSDRAEYEDAGISIDDTDKGYKFFLGYRINRYAAVEGFLADLGEATLIHQDAAISASMEMDTWGGAVLGIVPLHPHIEAFAKLGLHAWDMSAKMQGQTLLEDDGTDVLYGIGARYIYYPTYSDDAVSVRIEYERFELDEESVDLLSAGISYHF
ncbi:outer membrane beta-barrel protein [Photobacterium halotolerans]|uniref:outer membrane beta-barrel protein n=1 Tax=Photobacterium halotolerans TaxID=265726 RepID=UPI00041E0164|nr:outer membrane beta-barrel protein [Photobacterium halotolerans]NAX48233.1 outer membrane beta-barrel protein [Photobacterium halotolerans]